MISNVTTKSKIQIQSPKPKGQTDKGIKNKGIIIKNLRFFIVLYLFYSVKNLVHVQHTCPIKFFSHFSIFFNVHTCSIKFFGVTVFRSEQDIRIIQVTYIAILRPTIILSDIRSAWFRLTIRILLDDIPCLRILAYQQVPQPASQSFFLVWSSVACLSGDRDSSFVQGLCRSFYPSRLDVQ